MLEPDTPDSEALPPSPEVISRLVQSHRLFLAFLQKRLPSQTMAEEILQAAYVRAMEKGGAIRDSENAVAWFYRLLRNALIDHYRRSGVASRAHDLHMAEQAIDAQMPSESDMHAVICTCMNTLIQNLKPEYANLIEQVDLQNKPLAQAATDLGITPNNAAVRLHRARQALKQQLEKSCGTCANHGCLNCTCGQPSDHTATHSHPDP